MKHVHIASLFFLSSWLMACSEMQPPAPNGSLPQKSIYQLASNWKTQEDTLINIEGLKGKVTVLAMIYTSCKAACPRIIADLKRIESGLGVKKDSIRFVLISMDPENDSPEKLRELAANYALNLQNWILLTGDSNDVLELANVLDVRIRRNASGDITDHSNLIFVLDKEGVITHRQEGLSVPSEESIAAVKKLLE